MMSYHDDRRIDENAGAENQRLLAFTGGVRGLRIYGLDPQQFEVLQDFSPERQSPGQLRFVGHLRALMSGG